MPRVDGDRPRDDRAADEEDEGAGRGRRLRKSDGEGAPGTVRDRGPIATAGHAPPGERGGMKSGRKRSTSYDGERSAVRRGASSRKRSLDGPKRPASENDTHSLGESWVAPEDVSKLRGLYSRDREPSERRGRRARRQGSDTSRSQVSWHETGDESAADEALKSDDSKASKQRSRRSSVQRGAADQDLEADLREMRKQRKKIEEQKRAMEQQEKHIADIEKRLEERSQKSKSSPGRSAASSSKSKWPELDAPRPMITADWQKPHERGAPVRARDKDLPAPPDYRPLDKMPKAGQKTGGEAAAFDIATPREPTPPPTREVEVKGTAASVGFCASDDSDAELSWQEIRDKYPDQWRKFCEDRKKRSGLADFIAAKKKAKEQKMKEEHDQKVEQAKALLAASRTRQDFETGAEFDRVQALEEQLKLVLKIQQETEDERMALQMARDDEARAHAAMEEQQRRQEDQDAEAAQQAELERLEAEERRKAVAGRGPPSGDGSDGDESSSGGSESGSDAFRSVGSIRSRDSSKQRGRLLEGRKHSREPQRVREEVPRKKWMCYGVRNVETSGVYATWQEAKEASEGRKGEEHMGFNSLGLAWQWVNEGSQPAKVRTGALGTGGSQIVNMATGADASLKMIGDTLRELAEEYRTNREEKKNQEK